MPAPELTEEEVFDNDIDPIEAIREIRREEGVAEDDLPERLEGSDHGDSDDEDPGKKDGADELAEFDKDKDDDKTADDETGSDDTDGETGDTDADDNADAESDTGSDKEGDGETSDEAGETAAKGDEAPVETVKFRANGQDFEFTQEEILAQFETVFGQAANYTQKMQKIAPYRKMISALEQEGVTHDALNLALDALKGDKGAIKKILENNKLDSYDLTADDDDKAPVYSPTNYGKDETSLEIDEVISTIQNDEEFKITTNVIDDQWDPESRQVIAKNPKYILGLHNDIKAGIYDKVSPAAMKMKVLDGNSKSDIEYYMIAGEQLRVAMEAEAKTNNGQSKVDELNKDAQNAGSEFEEASSQANRKRSASSTGTRADRKGVIDYLDDDDEAFDEWYKNLQSNI